MCVIALVVVVLESMLMGPPVVTNVLNFELLSVFSLLVISIQKKVSALKIGSRQNNSITIHHKILND